MVGRIDLERLARVSEVIATHADIASVGWEPVLWDSENVEDIMPLADGPIENLGNPLLVVVLAERRRLEDPPGFFMMNLEEREGTRVAPARTGIEAWKERTQVGTAPSIRRERGGWTGHRGWFVPTYFVVSGSALAVYGDLTATDGRVAVGASFNGIMWHDDTMKVLNRDGDSAPPNVAVDMALQGVWAYFSAVAQNLAWCITHAEQFPLSVEPASTKPNRKDHVRAARKIGALDLPSIRVVELRPRKVEVVRTPGDGTHRKYRYSFPVRGHWRRYKTGNLVWVAGYWKAQDKPRITTVERF